MPKPKAILYHEKPHQHVPPRDGGRRLHRVRILSRRCRRGRVCSLLNICDCMCSPRDEN